MKIEILQATFCDGVHVKVGEVVEASTAAANLLIAINKACAAIDEPPKPRGRKKSPVDRMVDEGELVTRDAGE